MHFHQLYLQMTFATAQRAPWLKVELEEKVWETIAARCQALGCRPVAVGGMPDHVHLLVECSPEVSVAGLARDVRGASSESMCQQLAPDVGFQWQEGYGALTLRSDEVEKVARYIRNQKALHVLGKLSKVLERAG